MSSPQLINTIRQQLSNHFNEAELIILGYDSPLLLPVYQDLPPYPIDKAVIIDRLIWYAQRESVLELLYGLIVSRLTPANKAPESNSLPADVTPEMADPVAEEAPSPPSKTVYNAGTIHTQVGRVKAKKNVTARDIDNLSM